MKKDALKSNLSLLFLCIAGNTLTISPDVQRKNMALYAKLIVELGPERAADFKQRLEQKHRKPTKIPQPVKPVTPPQPTPVIKPVAQPPVTIQPPMAPPAPPKWLLDAEKEDFNTMISQLQLYMSRVYDCLNDFFNRNNAEPYRTHVNCFKTQLKFIQTQLQQYPQAQTSAGNTLFTALKKIANALERSQDLMCQTLDHDYPSMSLGAVSLGMNMKQIEVPVNQQRNIINQQIGILRNELRKAQATEMLHNVNKPNIMINLPFDYAKDKHFQELLNTLTHRVKK